MGCKNAQEPLDLDLITASGGIGDLKITKNPPPEVQIQDVNIFLMN